MANVCLAQEMLQSHESEAGGFEEMGSAEGELLDELMTTLYDEAPLLQARINLFTEGVDEMKRAEAGSLNDALLHVLVSYEECVSLFVLCLPLTNTSFQLTSTGAYSQ